MTSTPIPGPPAWLSAEERAAYDAMLERLRPAWAELEAALKAADAVEKPRVELLIGNIAFGRHWLLEHPEPKYKGPGEKRLEALDIELADAMAAEAHNPEEAEKRRAWDAAVDRFIAAHDVYLTIIRECWERKWMPEISDQAAAEAEAG